MPHSGAGISSHKKYSFVFALRPVHIYRGGDLSLMFAFYSSILLNGPMQLLICHTLYYRPCYLILLLICHTPYYRPCYLLLLISQALYYRPCYVIYCCLLFKRLLTIMPIVACCLRLLLPLQNYAMTSQNGGRPCCVLMSLGS